MTEYNKSFIHASELFQTLLPLLKEGNLASFTVTGMSMWPFICHGRDQVVVTACDPASLCVGDIVLLQTPLGNYLLHRVTALRPNAFETTGDGNCFRDGWFPRECVKARVETVIRNGRAHDCRSFGWRVLSALWRGLFPVRGFLLRLLRCVGHGKARLRKWLRRSVHN